VTFSYERTAERLTVRRPGTRWLSNGFDGGYAVADAAYNLTVPEGFDRTDLAAYAAERLGEVPAGPTLLTGVKQRHAAGAAMGPIEVVATAGLSNPARLPIEPECGDPAAGPAPVGTVNLIVGSRAPLTEGGLAGLLATAVEAKAATLLPLAGCSGTTSDAVAVGASDGDDPAAFAGSATELGNAARVCVRDAIRAARDARYDDLPAPESAAHGAVATGEASRFEP